MTARLSIFCGASGIVCENMATTHGLTVLAHSCIKPPRNPKTGLSSTLHERAKAYHTFILQNGETDLNANSNDQEDDIEATRSVHVYTNPAIDDISSQLQDLDDSDFYQKLVQLKNEHKKTLYLCEQLYKKKVLGENPQSNSLLDDVPTSYGHLNESLRNDNTESKAYEQRDVSHTTTTKPPTGRSQFLTSPSVKKPGVSTMPMPRPSSAPVYRRRGSLTRSLEEEVWAKLASERAMNRESADSDTELNTERLLRTSDDVLRSADDGEIAAAMTRIDDMWENFSVEDYAPRQSMERPSSASVTRKEKERKEKEWRHRITIPKPFKMTLREESKEKSKSKVQIEHEQKLLEEKMQEEIECQKKFKAQPVPAHIYLPLYDEINEKNEARRRYIKHYSQDLLKSQEKPFKFHTRERVKEKHTRTCSAPTETSDTTFKARPVPGYLYDSSIDDQIKEEEEYRKIRIKLRAEEQYRRARLPENMEVRQKIKEMNAKEKKVKSKRKSASANKVKHEVPDYEELYRHFQKELQRRKQEREGTVVKPFKLSTVGNAKKERILEDMKKDEETLRENRWPYMTARTTPRKSLGMCITYMVNDDHVMYKDRSS